MNSVPRRLSMSVRPGFTKNNVHTIITPVSFSPTFGKRLGSISAFLMNESVTVSVNSSFERVTSRAPELPWWRPGTKGFFPGDYLLASSRLHRLRLLTVPL